MNKKILIIGAGNIGSRHLQGLSSVAENISIYVVDPYQPSLDVCKERWQQVEGNHPVKFLHEIPADIGHIDCAILSSSADVRAKITIDLLTKYSVGAVLFEKVLFQNIDDYAEIENILLLKKIPAWVNCPRRIWPAYKDFKQKYGRQSPVHLSVSGSMWGLGCNSVHMLDCLSFMCGEIDYQVTGVQLDANIISSKRPGFVEFTGQFMGKFKDGSTFDIASFATPEIPYTLTLKSAKASLIVHEDLDFYDLYENGEWTRQNLEIPRQSQLSGEVISEIISKKTCELTDFSESVRLHIPYLQMLIDHHNHQEGKSSRSCPIT